MNIQQMQVSSQELHMWIKPLQEHSLEWPWLDQSHHDYPINSSANHSQGPKVHIYIYIYSWSTHTLIHTLDTQFTSHNKQYNTMKRPDLAYMSLVVML